MKHLKFVVPALAALAVVPVLAALAFGGCGTSSSNNNPPDSGVSACTDMTGSATPTVGINTTNGGVYGNTYSFSPGCVQINPGQSVTFTGNYNLHTLERTTQTVATATNPLPATPYSGPSPVTFGPFPDSGSFGFVCTIHHFTGTV